MEFDPEIIAILDRIRGNPSADETFDYAWQEGRNLYGSGRYFELHEVFEFQWKKEVGPRRLLFHGWIQLAISLNKIFVKPNPRGARMQAEKAREKFLSLGETKALSPYGTDRNREILEFLEELLGHFEGENGWDHERIRKISPPEIDADGKEWFSISAFYGE
ncbi:DUF309 domain-containing protein [Leptospira wolffii]|uniref:DUF309 domain-containing protein n=1 Tax=Leptospira wolffii TaxID=409998 RepID=UPI0002FDB8F4|nr:DUF309 domain-containing protein [Leptospira wolffii]EPG67299.1 PF03745 domain protein [Leptospira wolffii serovar Khorat str. Khorat-H2]